MTRTTPWHQAWVIVQDGEQGYMIQMIGGSLMPAKDACPDAETFFAAIHPDTSPVLWHHCARPFAPTSEGCPTTVIARFRLLVLPFLLLLALPHPATAQDLEAAATHLNIGELTGVETAVSRSYAMDVDDIIAAIDAREAAEEENGDPEDEDIDDGIQDGPLTMMALVAEFDTPDNAAEAYATLQDRLQQQLETYSGTDADTADLPDLGDEAVQVSTTRDTGPTLVLVSGVLAHDGAWLYLALVVSADDSAPDAAHELVDFGLGESASDEEVIYRHTGRSQGGPWAKLPAADDLPAGNATSALTGTMPIYDNQLVPAG